MKIKNIEKAADRIKRAIQKNERIILYGDADLDGVGAVIVLREAIKNLAGKVTAIYFPEREKEGYGLTENALRELKKFSPALLITLDLGITNFKEVKLAKKMGFEVIIVDHHQVIDKLPQAKIIVDPKQKGDKYPFKELAAAGVAFKLAEALLKDKMSGRLRKKLLEIVALSTIADMMIKKKDNLEFINLGLLSIEKSEWPAIKAFLKIAPIKGLPDLNQKISKIISLLNVRDVKRGFPASYRLFDCSLEKKAKELVKKLLKKDKIRKEKTNKMIAEIKERIEKEKSPSPIVFEGDADWDFGLIPTAASIICQQYKRPTFLFKKLKERSEGTVRAPFNVDSVALMKKCKRYLISYGGHPRASGFRLKNENLEKFKNCLIKHYTGNLNK